MSFLAPLFLFGALAVGLPILFHLIRRTTREKKSFSSLMFLMASPPRLTQRNRIEHLLLLLLRCAVICLLALGFARPFLKQAMAPPAGTNGERILLLVDATASMRRADLWSDACKQVDVILHNAAVGDQVALFTFDRQLKPLFTFDEWNAAPAGERSALLSRRLVATSPGWGSTQTGSALIQAAETLADPGGKGQRSRGRIELITDLQEGSHLEQLQGYEWPKGVEVSTRILKPRNAGNASLQLVPDNEDSDTKVSGGVRVRIANAPGSTHEQFKVGWARSDKEEFTDKANDVYVPAGQSRVLAIPSSSTTSQDRILLRGDDENFDNLVFASSPEAVKLNVVFIGNETKTDTKQALYFLGRALQSTRHQTVWVSAHRPGELIPADEARASCLFVVAAPLSSESAKAIRDQAVGGKTLLVIQAPGMQATLERLLEVDQLSFEEVHSANYTMLGEIDFRHPIFAPFADPRFSDFTKIHFWKYSRLDPAGIPKARVLARFDNGDPAFLEAPVGSGRVLILTSSWQPEASQLALSSKFVPLLYSILESSGAPVPLPAQYQIGDVVPLGQLTGTAWSQMAVRLPDGSQVSLQAGETNFSRTELPGVYTLASEGISKKFIVNLDPSESRITPLPVDELERLGVPTARTGAAGRTEAERKTRFHGAELENRQKLWRWFIAGTLVVLLLESWLAGRASRRASAPSSLVPS